MFILMAVYIVTTRLLLNNSKILQLLSNVILDNGGEGVILRKPASPYVPGRSAFLVKLKVQTKNKERKYATNNNYVNYNYKTQKIYIFTGIKRRQRRPSS